MLLVDINIRKDNVYFINPRDYNILDKGDSAESTEITIKNSTIKTMEKYTKGISYINIDNYLCFNFDVQWMIIACILHFVNN